MTHFAWLGVPVYLAKANYLQNSSKYSTVVGICSWGKTMIMFCNIHEFKTRWSPQMWWAGEGGLCYFWIQAQATGICISCTFIFQDIHLSTGKLQDIHLSTDELQDIHPSTGELQDIHLSTGELQDIYLRMREQRCVSSQGLLTDCSLSMIKSKHC